MFNTVLANLITLFICLVFGFALRKSRLLGSDATSGMSALLINVTMPCMIIISMQKPFSRELLYDSATVIILSAVIFLLSAVFGYVVARLFKAGNNEIGVWMFAVTFPNTGYMGFPILEAVLGKESNAIYFGAMANISFNILAFTLGIVLINHNYKNSVKLSVKSILTNRAIIATMIGLLLFVFSLTLPDPVYNALKKTGDMTTPLSMIIIGMILAGAELLKIVKGWKIYVVCFARLIVVPFLVLMVLKPFISDMLILSVIVLLSAMPVATITAIFANQYKTNEELASQLVLVSTLLSLFTIPLIANFL